MKFTFDLINGLGLILNEDMKFISVLYINGNKLSIPKEEATLIDDLLTTSLLDSSFENHYNYRDLMKGEDYFKRGNVLNYALMGKTISGVNRSDTSNIKYSSNITFAKNSIRATCDCPVGAKCKHTAAILYKIKNDMDYLISNNQDETTSYQDRLINKILKDNNPDIDYETYYELYKNIDFRSRQNIFDIFNKLNKYRTYQSQRLKEMILFNEDAFSYINDYKNKNLLFNTISNVVSFNERFNKIRSISNMNCEAHEVFFKCLINNDFTLLKQYVFSSYNLDFKNTLLFLINHENLDDNFIEYYFIKIKEEYDQSIYYDLTDKILDKASFSIRDYLIKKYPECVRISVADILKYDSDTALNLILKISNKKEAISILSNEKDRFYYDNKILFTKVLFNLYLETNDRVILNILQTYDDMAYVVKILDHTILKSNYFYDNLFSILKPDFKIEVYSKKLIYKYFLYLDDILILALIDNDNLDVIYEMHPYIKYKNCTFVEYVVSYIKNMSSFKEKLSEKNEEIQLLINKEKFEKYNNSINDLETKIDYLKFDDDMKVNLYPTLNILYNDKNKFISLELKIGYQDKSYIIKSISEFFYNVNNEIFFKYGKNLAFSHTIDNFTSKSQELLDNIMILYYPSMQNLREININSLLASKIIDIYKNDYINIKLNNNIIYFKVSDDIIDFKISIDSNKRLVSKYNNKNTISLGGNIYYFDIENEVISKINLSRNEKALLEFSIQNNGMDLSIVKDKFRDDILARYESIIEVSNDIKDEFVISKLRIDAKFDITIDLSIIVKLQFFKYDKETDITMISSVDKSRVLVLLRYLYNLGFSLSDGVLQNELILKEDYNVISFLKMDFSKLKELCNVYLSEDITKKKLLNLGTASINIKYENNIFSAFVRNDSFKEEELYNILKSIRQKKNYVLLDDNRIVDISNDDAKDFYNSFVELNLDINNINKEARIPVYKAIKMYAKDNNIMLDDYIKEIHNDIISFKDKKIELPNVNATLRDYQKEGFNFLYILKKHNLSGILADDMGLGKTLEIITLLESDLTCMPSIVICPKTLIFNWVSEVKKFLSNSFDVIKILGQKNERIDIISNIKSDKRVLYLISYDSLRNDIDLFNDINFNYIILDEAQYIKNVFAKKSKSVKALSGLHRFALTGTPIENNIADLWSIFDFLMPGFFPDLNVFIAKYSKNQESLRKIVSPFILRRTKKEVLNDLPDKIETIISCPMTKEQQSVYEAYKLMANDTIESGGKAMDLLPILTRLRQICISPDLFSSNYNLESGKLNMLYDMVFNLINEGHKILIFSSFVEALNLISLKLNENSIKFHMLTGKTDIYSREKYVNEFNAMSDIKIFLISLKAGGTGLNLVGADTVIHLDPWWNISAESQATDRAYRIGQKRNVFVYKLVCEQSIEERIIELQNIKKDIIDKVISNDDSSITSFSLDDMKFILK